MKPLVRLATFPTAFLALIGLGCGTVRPHAEYERAGSLIQQRTGALSIYDPESESVIDGRVGELLNGGITSDEAVQIALLNNKAFQSLFMEIGVSKAEFVQSTLLSNPALSFSARFPEGGGRSNLSFGLAQEIVDLWQIPVRKKVAQAELDRTIQHVAQMATELVAQVKSAYYQAVVARRTAEIRDENLKLIEHSLELAQHRFDAGEATILDVNLVKSNVLDVQTRHIAARRDERTSEIALARLFGFSTPMRSLDLTDPLPSPGETIEDDAVLVKRAFDARLDIRAAAAELDKAEYEVKRQQRAIVPSVTLGIDGERPELRAPRSLNPLPPDPPIGSISRPTASQTLQDYVVQQVKTQRSSLQSMGQSTKDLFLQQLDEKRARDLDKRQAVDLLLGPSLQVTLPIWDQNQAQIAKAHIQLQQKQKDFEELLVSVVEDVRTAAETLRSTQQLIELSTNETLPLAEQNVDTAQRVYEAGEESILALITAQTTLLAQRESQVAYLGDYAMAAAGLERAMGGRVTDEATPSASTDSATEAAK
ncbi:MAG: TolC family protein [Candidatus Hydrogenedentes bacterium]|nr:TolC family protein [Candidatus Hydrogenedentota bacterium]